MSFKDISSRNELADYLGIPRKNLTYVLYKAHVESFYTSFDIPKKDGSARHILAPTGILKTIQTVLAKALTDYHKEIKKQNGTKSNISHAFEKDKSIITNAKIHRNKRFVICFDLKDYFETFHFGRVVGYFEKNNSFLLPPEVAVTIAQLSCYCGFLPQGAPTSPVISNLISESLDYRLLKIAKKYHLDYTRYADDLTFSTNSKCFIENKADFIETIKKEVESSGFSLNEAKTRITYNDSQQIVTGLVVNKKINVPRSFYKDTRAMWHSYYTTGGFRIGEKEGTCDQLEGRFSFVDQLEHYNNKTLLKEEKHGVYYLSSKEKTYRDFLFYTHFINNKKPVIITEGKTDILYLKAALKNLYKEFPLLITREKNGYYRFHITFFKKTRHWKYFFGISLDGADAMKRLFDYFSKDNPINLCEYFSKRNAVVSNASVMFLYDNEKNTKRPLRTFINYAKLNDNQVKEIETKNYTLVENVSNLFLVTVPLPNGKKECELEDLFSEETLNTQIGGRSFSRKDEDPSKYYNKDVFSKYVFMHYKEIDFSGFRPLLQIIAANAYKK